MKMKRLQSGFQLIELLVVFSVISILTALSIPVYSSLINSADLIDAKDALSRLAIQLEHYHFQNDTYRGATFSGLHIDPELTHHTYQLQLESLNRSSFLISAIKRNSSKNNTCVVLTLNSLGEKGIRGRGKISDCW